MVDSASNANVQSAPISQPVVVFQKEVPVIAKNWRQRCVEWLKMNLTTSSIEKLFHQAIGRLHEDDKNRLESDIASFKESITKVRIFSKEAENDLKPIEKELKKILHAKSQTLTMQIIKEFKALKIENSEVDMGLASRISQAVCNARAKTHKLTDEYEAQGFKVEETCTNVDVMESAEENLNSAIEKATNELQVAKVTKETTSDETEKNKLEEKIKFAEKKLGYLEEKLQKLRQYKTKNPGKILKGSNDDRDAAKAIEDNPDQFDQVPGVTNFRVHVVTTTTPEREQRARKIGRGGAIADYNDGARLQYRKDKLKKMEENTNRSIQQDVELLFLTLETQGKVTEELLKKNEHLSPIVKYFFDGSNLFIAQGEINLKFSELFDGEASLLSRKDGTSITILQDNLKKLKLINDSLSKVGVEAIDISGRASLDALKGIINEKLNELEKEIFEREEKLTQQFLIALKEQYKGNRSTPPKSQFVMTQMSLLDPGKLKGLSHGFIQNEKFLSDDMRYIFNKFNDKTIQFDEGGKGAYVDSERKIHLPKPEGNTPDSVKLKTVFFTVPVQGDRENQEFMKANEKELKKLEEMVNSKNVSRVPSLQIRKQLILERIQKLKEVNRGSYDLAKDLLNISKIVTQFIDADAAEAANCFSGKDRTGELLKRIVAGELSCKASKNALLYLEIKKIKSNKQDQKQAELLERLAFAIDCDHVLDSKVEEEIIEYISNYPENMQVGDEERAHFKQMTIINMNIKLGVEIDYEKPIKYFKEDIAKTGATKVVKNNLIEKFSHEIRRGEDKNLLYRKMLYKAQLLAKLDSREKTKKTILTACEEHLAREEGIARTIAHENTGLAALKLSDQKGIGLFDWIIGGIKVKTVAD